MTSPGAGLERREFLTRGILLAAGVGLTPALLSACGSSGSHAPKAIKSTGVSLDKASVELWSWTGVPPYTPVYQAVSARLGAKFSGSSVKPTYLDFGSYVTKFKTSLSGGVPPDLAMMPWAGDFRDLVQTGALRPVDDLLASFPAFFPNVIDSLKFNGQTWAIPLDVNTLTIAYNIDIFNKYGLKPPTTQRELLSTSKTLQQAGITALESDFGDLSPAADIWFAQMAYTDPTNQAVFQADRGQLGWDDPRFLQAAEQVAELRRIFPAGAESITGQPMVNRFVKGTTAMMYSVGNFATGTLDSASGGKLNWGVFPFPPQDSGTLPRATGGIAEMFSIPRQAKHIDAAVEVLRLMTDQQGTVDLVTNGLIPSYPESSHASNAKLYSTFLALQKTAATRVIYTTSVYQALENSVQQLIAGKAAPRDVVSAMVKAAK